MATECMCTWLVDIFNDLVQEKRRAMELLQLEERKQRQQEYAQQLRLKEEHKAREREFLRWQMKEHNERTWHKLLGALQDIFPISLSLMLALFFRNRDQSGQASHD